ncbi:MAG: YhfC family intramembrane metalloprotease [Anaerolineales bacterium]|nr:YhfC family intramembrane metalloprotease [Anaerolineales bacterium]
MQTNRNLALTAAGISALMLIFLGLTQPETLIPALNAFLMIGLGLGLGLLLHHRFGLPWGLYGVGALTFVLSQVGHIPFNSWLLNPWLAKIAPGAAPGSKDLLVWAVFLGLSAGVFEETARWLVLGLWRKDIRTWRKSLMYGAGHAGIEAILVGILAFIAFLQLFLYRQFDPQTITGLAEGEQLAYLRQTIASYWAADWWGHLWGALERFSVIPVHLAATVMVYRAVRERKIFWYLAAVLWHALVDFFAVYASQTWSIPITEGILFVLGVLGWGIVFILRDSHPPPEAVQQEINETIPPGVLMPAAQDQPLTINDLEESRYD